MPKKIPTGRAQPGDVLAEPVVHGDGQRLLVANTTLEKHHLDLLRQRGVLLVTIVDEGDVEGGATAPAAPLDPEQLKKIVVDEGRWFGDTRKDPIVAEVFRWTVKMRTGGETGA
jgi:hypothetical protein